MVIILTVYLNLSNSKAFAVEKLIFLPFLEDAFFLNFYQTNTFLALCRLKPSVLQMTNLLSLKT